MAAIDAEIEGPEQDDYPPIPQQDLEAASARVAARLQARIVRAKYPEKTGDRSARFHAVTVSGESFFIKALGTLHETTRAFFQHEIYVLHALNTNPPSGFNVPKLLDHDVEAGILWMATEWVDATPLSLNEGTFQSLVFALRAIREMPADIVEGHRFCPKQHCTPSGATYRDNIEDTVGRLTRVGLLDPAYRDRIIPYVQRCASYLDDHETVYSAHGDFAPGNLTIRDDRIVVLDWESSHLDRGPIDVAHYVSTRDVWRSELADRLEAELREHEPEILVVAKIERLAGRANDTYQRRRKRDSNALSMLEDLVQQISAVRIRHVLCSSSAHQPRGRAEKSGEGQGVGRSMDHAAQQTRQTTRSGSPAGPLPARSATAGRSAPQRTAYTHPPVVPRPRRHLAAGCRPVS